MNNNFLCGYNKNDAVKPIDSEVIAPYAVVKFENVRNKTFLTVGNESNPHASGSSSHTAVIKSFQYGTSNGHKAKIEIIDQEGGQFATFVNRIWKTVDRASKDYVMYIQWGWVTGECGGRHGIIKSPWITVLPLNLEVEFGDGVIKYTVTATDLMQVVFHTRQAEVFGTEDAKIPLKEAIRRLAQSKEPKFDVIFPKANYASCESQGGQTAEWGFAEFGCEGPLNTWSFDGQNKLNTILKWLGDYKSSSGKGFTVIWDNSKEKPTLAIIEDPEPRTINGRTEAPSEKLIIGTYIINGGNDSPVINFTPKLNWVGGLANMAGATGGTGSAFSGETKKKTKAVGVQNQDAGIAQYIPISNQAVNAYGASRALERVEDAQNVNALANQTQLPSFFAPIEAELRLQGDPRTRFVLAINAMYKYISLVVINPFYIAGTKGCGDWLAQPSCNSTLTNKFWLITGVDHSIREGSYTTTMQLKLIAPGIDVPGTDPIGGAGSGGPILENAS